MVVCNWSLCRISSWEKAIVDMRSGENKFGLTGLWDSGGTNSTTKCQFYPLTSFSFFFDEQLRITNWLDKKRFQWTVTAFTGLAVASIHQFTWNSKSHFLTYALFLFLKLNERKKPTHRKEHGQTLAQVQLEDISVLSSIRLIELSSTNKIKKRKTPNPWLWFPVKLQTKRIPDAAQLIST